MTVPSDDQDREMMAVSRSIVEDINTDPEVQQPETQIEPTRTRTTTTTTTSTTTSTTAITSTGSLYAALLENIHTVPFTNVNDDANATHSANDSADADSAVSNADAIDVSVMTRSLQMESVCIITGCHTSLDNDDHHDDDHEYPPPNEKCHLPENETISDKNNDDTATKLALSPPILARAIPRRPYAVPGAYSITATASIRRFVTGVLTPMPITTSRRRNHEEAVNELEQLPETQEIQHNESNASPQEEQYSYKNLWIILAAALIMVVLTGIALSIGLTAGGSSHQSRNKISMTPTISPLDSQLSIDLNLERIILHCSNTTNTNTTITDNLLAPIIEQTQNRSNYIQLLYEGGWISNTNISIYSCQAEHVALLYLASRQDDTIEYATRIHHMYLMAILFISWNGLQWENNTKWLVSNSHCDWYGIECNSQEDPISLHLHGNSVRGTIPTMIGFLTTLQSLRLDGNIQIPVEINNPTRNPIFGTGKKGTIFGSIPTELSRLTNLTIFTLTDNNITGSIPTELTLLTNLEVLMAGSNSITGGIPITISNMKELKLLFLDLNEMSSSMPSSMAKLTQLVEISLYRNKFNGTLPFLNVENSLMFLDVQVNRFSGTLPTTIGLCTNLINLALASNRFSGTLPSELGQLAYLKALFVSNTLLEGSVPPEVCQLRTNGKLTDFEANCENIETRLSQCPVPDCCTKLSDCGFVLRQ